MAGQYDDATLLRVAYAFEQAPDFHKGRPDIQKGAHESAGGGRSV